jgi:ABC-type dipeptide/oligopeptide/nickel transport system permease subunit
MAYFPWKKVLRNRTVWFSLIVMLTLGLVAALTPWIAPHDPYRMDPAQSYLPPMWVKLPNNTGDPQFPLGTDRYGRDILSRLIYGTRTAIGLALIAVPLAALIGTVVGILAGYAGGWSETFLMRLTDVINSLPGIMFLVITVLILRDLFAPTWQNGMITLIIGFAVVAWVSLARLVRGSVLQLKGQAFIEAARSLGASPWHIISKHLVPNVLHLILVWIIINIPAVILLEAVLGYIGVGVTSSVDGGEFNVVSWGGLFFSGRSALSRNPFILLIPSICIMLISMSFFLLGDYLNEVTGQNKA